MQFTIEDIRKAKELVSLLGVGQTNECGDSPWEVGKYYLIRTVTMIDTGKLIAVTDKELVLEEAAWIADTGRFADALTGSKEFNEVEPFPNGKVIIGRGAIIDAVQITNLPREQK